MMKGRAQAENMETVRTEDEMSENCADELV